MKYKVKMTNIYLSVVLCTYNDEEYIGKAISSILNQTYPYFEFIIVNDGSTDNTLNIINSYNDHRIVVINKTNSGLADSLNIGIAAAKYEWIARMDADDISLPNRFETQVRYIEKSVGVIGGQCEFIDEEENVMGNSHHPSDWKRNRILLMNGMSPIIHPTTLINKAYYIKAGMYDVNFKSAQDVDLWIRMSKLCKIINVNDVVLKYRLNPNGISRKKRDEQSIFTLVSCIKRAKGIKVLDEKQFREMVDKLKESKLCIYYMHIIHKRTESKGIKVKIYTLILSGLSWIIRFA